MAATPAVPADEQTKKKKAKAKKAKTSNGNDAPAKDTQAEQTVTEELTIKPTGFYRNFDTLNDQEKEEL